jgi:type IV secretion system protein VirB11
VTGGLSQIRLVRKLHEALGEKLCDALVDDEVVEIMLNPDGQLFIERLGKAIEDAGCLSLTAAETIIGAVAHALRFDVNTNQPIVSGELPISGHRFEGLLPPVVTGPTFAIRRRASRVIALDKYVSCALMTHAQAETIRNAVQARKNIIVCGGTGTGKTTLVNAIVSEISARSPRERLIILEDTTEIQCSADNVVSLHTSDGVDMSRLLKSTMRLRPDRIIVGEVRDGAALTMLKAWNTGHPGGVATIHANSARSALQRLEQLTAEASHQPMQAIIADAVDVIISIERTAKGRRISDIVHVTGFAGGRYQTESYAEESRNAA